MRLEDDPIVKDLLDDARIDALMDLAIGIIRSTIARYPWLVEIHGDGGQHIIDRIRLECADVGMRVPARTFYGPPSRDASKPARTIPKALLDKGAYCQNCRTTWDLTLDHILPKSRGGGNEIDNLQILCQPCNSSKRTRTMQEWVSSGDAYRQSVRNGAPI